ncbi:hypothetical protein C4K00_2470 [Pseudomonas synxantha]|nr:hypothetical protein C4K00_2470 [Pseudomonas synxantha]AZE78370.1 hypothetical protein C4J99_2585 [Pseudomonas synxantha]
MLIEYSELKKTLKHLQDCAKEHLREGQPHIKSMYSASN